MHLEILNEQQVKLLPILKSFNKDFCLVGDTAIALHIGHRKSVDFDLFSFKSINGLSIQRKVLQAKRNIERVFVDEQGEFTVLIDGVKVTFLQYPFKFDFQEGIEVIKLPDLLTLAALKAYALGRRAKWKDYVDMYFILSNYFSMKAVVQKTSIIFGNSFNEKIFREQLAYFKDIDYSERVEYVKGFEVADGTIKRALIEFSLS
jgi:hypothetical protein